MPSNVVVKLKKDAVKVSGRMLHGITEILSPIQR
jgi:hypothetical protein